MNPIYYCDTRNDDVMFNVILNEAKRLKYTLTFNLDNRTNNGAIAFQPNRLCPLHLDGSGYAYWSKAVNVKQLSCEQFLRHIIQAATTPTTISVRLNDKYEAVVSPTSIVVGCQTFPLEKLDELVEARNKVCNLCTTNKAPVAKFDGDDVHYNLPSSLEGFRPVEENELLRVGDLVWSKAANEAVFWVNGWAERKTKDVVAYGNYTFYRPIA